MSIPVTTVSQGAQVVSVTPTVTVGAYAANKVIGGILTFSNILDKTAENAAILDSITIKFKESVQTADMNVSIFSQSPAGTFGNTDTAAILPADSDLLIGIYKLSTPSSVLGNHTIYKLDGISKVLLGSFDAASVGNLYVVVTPGAAVTPATDRDMIVTLGILGG